MTVPMALMDFVPVLLFGAAWVILYKDLKNKLDLCSGVLLPLGAVMVFVAGFLKAVWKMQKALGVNAVELFNKAMFPTQSIGFMLLAVGMLAGLVYIARKMKVKAAIPIFIVTFVVLMMMGYLSSRDFGQASANWIAQSVNTLGQGLLLFGTILLHKAGLADPDALKK